MPSPLTVCLLQVIDAEMGRRRLLEDTPIASTNEDPVFFDTDQIPWWAWVKRFHLPEVSRKSRLYIYFCRSICNIAMANMSQGLNPARSAAYIRGIEHLPKLITFSQTGWECRHPL